jgi:hypothetical protein
MDARPADSCVSQIETGIWSVLRVGTGKYPRGKKDLYEKALKQISEFISALSGQRFEWTAVQQQVDWATSKQSSVNTQHFARQFILNKAAALETGFLSADDLPSLMLMEKTRPQNQTSG